MIIEWFWRDHTSTRELFFQFATNPSQGADFFTIGIRNSEFRLR
jgi:hypothetical protein